MTPVRYLCSDPRIFKCVILPAKSDFLYVITARFLTGGIIMDYLAGQNESMSIKRRQEVERRRQCENSNRDWSDLATNHGLSSAFRGWKRQKSDAFLKKDARRNQTDFSPKRYISGFWSRNSKITALYSFKPLSLWWFVTAAIEN